MNNKLDFIKYKFLQPPKIEILNDNSILINGCKGIAHYSSGCICVKMNGYTVQIIGEGMQLCEYTFDDIEISGKISTIEFLRIK